MDETVYQIMQRRGVNLDWYEKRKGIIPTEAVEVAKPLDLVKSIFLTEEKS